MTYFGRPISSPTQSTRNALVEHMEHGIIFATIVLPKQISHFLLAQPG